MNSYDFIRRAVAGRKTVAAVYDGFRRLLAPHAIGTKKGIPRLLAYQYGGEGSKGPIVPLSEENWRCFDITRLENLAEAGDPWVSAGSHSKRSSCIDSIDLEVIGVSAPVEGGRQL